MKQLNEGLDFGDMVHQVSSELSIDEYSAKMGSDDEIVTLAFTVKGEQASKDLSNWFERGYDFILDAQVSAGEISQNKYLVFVEMDRRSRVPERVLELLDDLETLTEIPVSQWKIKIDGEEVEPSLDVLKKRIILSPHQYRINAETELNEMRELSGVEPHKIYKEQDSQLKSFIALAGL